MGTLARFYLQKMAATFEGAEPSKRQFPNLGKIYLLGIFMNVFPISDRRHVVMTPLLLLLSRMLLETPIKTPTQIARGLFISSLFTKANNTSFSSIYCFSFVFSA